MKMPGFTAGLSLNESKECYVTTQKDAITRGRAAVVPQQFGHGRRITDMITDTSLSLECGNCFGSDGSVNCEVLRTHCNFLTMRQPYCNSESLGNVKVYVGNICKLGPCLH